jgi:hypothetical protein
MMESIMVVFSSTTIPSKMVDYSIDLAKKRHARLIILDVRDKRMSEKVGALTENLGFMGEKVVSGLKKDISQKRCEVIFKKLSIMEEKAKENNIPYEIIVEKGSFIKNIIKVAKNKKVKTIICQEKDKLLAKHEGFEVIQL